jgi:hypothetical protein
MADQHFADWLLNILMNDLYERLPSALQSILAGEVPNEEWELIVTPKLKQSLVRATEQWEFVRSQFAVGSQDRRCRVPLLPTLHYCALKIGRVPSLPMAVQIIESSPLASGDMSARVYVAFTGYLRELLAGIEFVKQGWRCWKNPSLDLGSCVDWVIRLERHVQISMAGRCSHWENRKQHKIGQDVIRLLATPSNGLATVSASDIASALDISSATTFNSSSLNSPLNHAISPSCEMISA